MFFSIFLAALVAFVLGAFWYSPLMFGNLWMKINKAEHYTKEQLAAMQKKMLPYYVLQFLMTLVTMFVLYSNIKWNGTVGVSGYWLAFFMWLGYVMPTQVGAVIWGNTDRKYQLKQILIMAVYQFITFMLAVCIFNLF
ncbi:MAG: hypothetical protein QG614_570 [Patescibacteria group bacterium]|nr:hypothetical protein [Patescibacteria group bacterium]